MTLGGCLKLCLYGIRELASVTSRSNQSEQSPDLPRPMRVAQPAGAAPSPGALHSPHVEMVQGGVAGETVERLLGPRLVHQHEHVSILQVKISQTAQWSSLSLFERGFALISWCCSLMAWRTHWIRCEVDWNGDFFFFEFIHFDCTILSDLVSHFQKGITLGVYFEYYGLNEYLIFENIKY